MKLSIIIPIFNEQASIRELMRLVQSIDYSVDYEIIIVDDASMDMSYENEILIKLHSKPHKIKLFKNRINRGKGFSIRRGIKMATGDILIIQDADKEYDPNDIPRLIQPILKNEVSVVYGSRFLGCDYPKGMAWPNFVANKFLTFLTNILFKVELTDMETCYKVFRADILKGLKLKSDRFSFEPEVTALISKRGIEIKEVPITYNGRSKKEGKKIKARDLLFAVITLLKLRFIG